MDEAIERILRCARELSAAAEKAPEGQGFGGKVAQAVKARMALVTRARTPVLAASAAMAPKAEEDGFAEMLKKAVEERSGRKRHKEWAERERSRYTHPRKHTKGE